MNIDEKNKRTVRVYGVVAGITCFIAAAAGLDRLVVDTVALAFGVAVGLSIGKGLRKLSERFK